MTRKRLFNVLKIAVSLGLIAFILTRVDLVKTWNALREAHWGIMAVAFTLFVLTLPLRAFRWKALLDGLGVHASISRLTVLYFVGTFFNIFLPTGVGGDVVRAVEFTQDSRHGAEAIGTVFVDRLTGLLVLFVIALAALPFSFRLVEPGVTIAIVIIALAGLAGGWLLLQGDLLGRIGRRLPFLPAQDKLEDLYRAIGGCGRRALTRALTISVLFNLVNILVNYLIALALDVHLSPWHFFAFVPLISFSLTLPVSLGGLGVREGTYVLLFGQAGVAPEKALALSLAYYAITVVTGLAGGLVYAIEGARGLKRET
ncbi:MAG: flippase-like domain-containing protein [Anaerolineae bacterium]|nr:flippase-like domain-containing protein [Anaerolineae bacterium]